ncbi:MAG TPA: hypothetical protein VHV49_06680 [Pseudonocardiaceae bacterium]|nr:hypothetical protein [Pseudonocardiaceae bacterium]
MRSKTLLVAGAVAATLALAGCGPMDITGTAAPQGQQARQGSGFHGTTQASTVADLGAAVQHNTAQHNSVHVTMAMSVPEIGSINSTGDLTFHPALAEHLTMAMPALGGAMEMVLVHGTMYLKLPTSVSGALGETGKPWTKIDLGADSALTQSLGSTADLANQADPATLIQKIAAAGTITKVTHETVNGVATTHYAITVDVAKMAASLSGEPAEQRAQQELRQDGVRSVPFDIWVDGDNLPTRIVTHVAYAEPTTGRSEQVTLTIAYTDWGKPVTITAPPADQVGTLGGH